ncbi:MAG: Wzz/FepE/Etk N-terminal domain-containing protein [Streptosporangiaceae bacterium]
MSQQALDMRRYVQIVRRHKLLIGTLTILGLLAGGAYAVVRPPMPTSTALIVIPQSGQAAQAAQAATGNNGSTSSAPDPYMATQMVIADSTPVLAGALPNIKPATSVNALRNDVKANSLTSYVISISAKGKSAAAAESTANAVANSYVAYVGAKNSPGGHVGAQILQRATTATGSSRVTALATTGVIGALAGALIGVIVSLVISRHDRRLRERDDIANAIGIPVLASVPVAHPSDAAGWAKLLEDYKPGAVHAWQLRIALQQLGMPGYALGHPLDDGDDRPPYRDGDDGTFSLVLLTLSSDPGALALGPQLAVFAASLGIPTALVIGPQQDANLTATLRAACAAPAPESSKRPSLLQVIVSDDGQVAKPPGAVLTVVTAVIDAGAPKMPDTLRTTTTVIGVSAAAASADQLARAAVVADADGREITGILVADPDPADRTSGRIPQPARSSRYRRQVGLRSMITEIRRLASVNELG